MKRIWIVVADGVIAHIYQAPAWGAQLTLLRTLEHPEGRLHGRDLETDGAGSTASSSSSNRTSYRDAGPADRERSRFAAQVAQALDEGRRHSLVDEIWLVMPAQMLGRVRHELTTETTRLVHSSLDRRMVDADEPTLRAALKAWRPELL